MRTILLILLTVGIVVAGVLYGRQYWATETGPTYRTAEVKKGDLAASINATGTLEPEEVVDVGAQVQGKIESLGRDPDHPEKSIDYRSTVHEGTVLAHIDDAIFDAQVKQAEAAILKSQADRLVAKVKLEQAEEDLRRAQKLRERNVISEADYTTADTNQKAAVATVAQADATIARDEAALNMAKVNLGYTVIKSPVEGVIIARRVNVGQTVVASLNAPSLFLIAKDVRRIQVWASVNEADIGRIYPGQRVKFTVDARPKEVFTGEVLQIRWNAQMIQNVVMYTVVVATENADLKLLPYMTANLQFQADQRQGVLLVPNAALRWRPKGASSAGSGRPEGKGPPGKPAAPSDRGRVYVKDGPGVRAIEVQVGLSDRINTEISGDEVKAGLEVIVGENIVDAGSDAANPFAPKIFKGSGPSKG